MAVGPRDDMVTSDFCKISVERYVKTNSEIVPHVDSLLLRREDDYPELRQLVAPLQKQLVTDCLRCP